MNASCEACANVVFTAGFQTGVTHVCANQVASVSKGESLRAFYPLNFQGGAAPTCIECGKEIACSEGGGARRVFRTSDGRTYWHCGATGTTGWL